jgi:hypothetical protein
LLIAFASLRWIASKPIFIYSKKSRRVISTIRAEL